MFSLVRCLAVFAQLLRKHGQLATGAIDSTHLWEAVLDWFGDGRREISVHVLLRAGDVVLLLVPAGRQQLRRSRSHDRHDRYSLLRQSTACELGALKKL